MRVHPQTRDRASHCLICFSGVRDGSGTENICSAQWAVWGTLLVRICYQAAEWLIGDGPDPVRAQVTLSFVERARLVEVLLEQLGDIRG